MARERLVVPNVVRLEQMLSWPSWLGVRVLSIEVEWRRAKRLAILRKITTLPQRLALSPAERAEVEVYADELADLLDQTPDRAHEHAFKTLTAVTELLLEYVLPSHTEAIIEVLARAYLDDALHNLPWWAVQSAIFEWHRGPQFTDDAGRPYDTRFRPPPSALRKIATLKAWYVKNHLEKTLDLLAATLREEFTDDQRKKNLKRYSNEILAPIVASGTLGSCAFEESGLDPIMLVGRKTG
jgi:hypothetical protein